VEKIISEPEVFPFLQQRIITEASAVIIIQVKKIVSIQHRIIIRVTADPELDIINVPVDQRAVKIAAGIRHRYV
jgi:hypothetical protein